MWGLLMGNDPSDIARDLAMVSAFGTGTVYAKQNDFPDILRHSIQIIVVTSVIVFASIAAAYSGLLQVSYGLYDNEIRVGLNSWYLTMGHFVILLPVIGALGSKRTGENNRTLTIIFFLGVAEIMFVAFFTDSRSLFIYTLFVLLLWLRLQMFTGHGLGFLFIGSILMFIVYLIWGETTISVFEFSRLLKRVEATNDIMYEARYLEIASLIEFMWPERMFLGMGLGARFLADWGQGVIVEVGRPHMGAFTYLFLGGIPFFVVMIILPTVVAVKKFCSPGKFGLNHLAVYGGILGYSIQSFVSGGYYFGDIFLYGALLAKAFQLSRIGPRMARSA
jgi:hypothetical protein